MEGERKREDLRKEEENEGRTKRRRRRQGRKELVRKMRIKGRKRGRLCWGVGRVWKGCVHMCVCELSVSTSG